MRQKLKVFKEKKRLSSRFDVHSIYSYTKHNGQSPFVYGTSTPFLTSQI